MALPLRRLLGGLVALLVLALGAGAGIQLARATPAPVLHGELARQVTVAGHPGALPLPPSGEAALFLSGFGWLGASPQEAPVPIASVTKIMTALVVLRAHPLSLGAGGPTLTVSGSDYALYRTELEAGDSVVRVWEGETLTEFQLLEGLLLPSGDNLAVLLADWVAGSEPEFTTRMNRLAATLHLDATHFADSSGLNPASVSSARDLVTLTASAMANPVFRAIVALPEVSLPLAGTVRNYNPILGQQGVDGVKTGWTAAALGCLVFSADATVSGHPVALLGAVLGQPGGPMSGLVAAGRSALALLRAGLSQLRAVSLPLPGQAVARIKAAWAAAISVKPARRLSLVARAGSRLRLRLATRRLSAPFRRGARVGTLSLTTPGGFVSRLPLVTAGRLRPPSWQWRLTRPW